VIDEQATERGTFWRELPILLGVAIVVAVIMRAFVLQTFYIPSGSMQHTLDINDHVLVNKLVYDFRSPHRGEIVVFNAPTVWRANPEDKDFIKRVIGVGGDSVACDGQHHLMVNGYTLEESYLFHDGVGGADPSCDEPFDITVPAGRLWVMGDHRRDSGDSRQHYSQTRNIDAATIADKAVVGRAFVRFWPLSRITWLSVPGVFSRIPGSTG
jgi:signal peptidase I